MSSPNTFKNEDTRKELPSTPQRDFAYEAELIAEARAAAAAGLIVSQEQVDAWLDSLGTDNELPPPRPAG